MSEANKRSYEDAFNPQESAAASSETSKNWASNAADNMDDEEDDHYYRYSGAAIPDYGANWGVPHPDAAAADYEADYYRTSSPDAYGSDSMRPPGTSPRGYPGEGADGSPGHSDSGGLAGDDLESGGYGSGASFAMQHAAALRASLLDSPPRDAPSVATEAGVARPPSPILPSIQVPPAYSSSSALVSPSGSSSSMSSTPALTSTSSQVSPKSPLSQGAAAGISPVPAAVVAETPEEQLEEARRVLSSKDSIMEVGVLNVLKKWVTVGGQPQDAIDLLSDNYRGYAQMANLVAHWLSRSNATHRHSVTSDFAARQLPTDVETAVKAMLADLIADVFDQKKADTIFQGAVPDWLEEMIKEAQWRGLIYRLSERHRQSLMLNFAIQKIADSGHQMEIASVSTAVTYFPVFSRVFHQTFHAVFEDGADVDMDEAGTSGGVGGTLGDLCKLCGHTQHTYTFAQVLLRRLEADTGSIAVRRISQELEKYALLARGDAGHALVRRIHMLIDDWSPYPALANALSSALLSEHTSPADINVLYKAYSSPNPPPVALLRSIDVLQLLVRRIFDAAAPLPAHQRPAYVFLLAYAASVKDDRTIYPSSTRIPLQPEPSPPDINTHLLAHTSKAITDAMEVCDASSFGFHHQHSVDLLLTLIRTPVVAMGVVQWIRSKLTDPAYYSSTYHALSTPILLDVLRNIAQLHALCRASVLSLLAACFEIDPAHIELDAVVVIEVKRRFFDVMLDMLRNGYVLPVLACVQRWAPRADHSLIRYFVLHVLRMVEPPYSLSFVNRLLAIMGHPATLHALRSDHTANVVALFVNQVLRSNLPISTHETAILSQLQHLDEASK